LLAPIRFICEKLKAPWSISAASAGCHHATGHGVVDFEIGLSQLRQHREPNCLGGRALSEPRQHARAVLLEVRARADAEIVGDLLGHAPSDKPVEHLAFARRQPRDPLGCLVAFAIMGRTRSQRQRVVEGLFNEIDRTAFSSPVLLSRCRLSGSSQ
jgi:hypothetical protein